MPARRRRPAEAPTAATAAGARETLAASLLAVLPSLPHVLADADAIDELTRLADALAPIHCAGFEVRLDGDATVDLVQRIAAARGEPGRLAHHIDVAGLDQDPAWRCVAAFCRAWGSPQAAIHTGVLAAFLGFDAATACATRPTPSLYLSLSPGAGVQEDLDALITTASTLLRGEPLSAATMTAVAACRAALPEGAAVTDLGFMLARPVDALRLVVAQLARHDAAVFLAELPWAGTPPDIDAAEALLPAGMQHVIVSIDVTAGVLPRIGLECEPGYAEADLPIWREALDSLVTAGLCRAEKRDALLRWPGHVEPIDGKQPWPASLLHESLLNRSDEFLVLARRLTFLKMVCDEHGVRQAKAYFGYGPRSFAPAPIGVTASPRPAAAPARMSRELLEVSWQRALRFLLDRRGADGLWLEFPRVLAGTDEWATAYIADALASLPDDSARGAAAQAWEALCRRRGERNGWGYNADLPVDADSTLWGLRLANALGRSHQPRALAARHVLESHFTAEGVATYARAAEADLRHLLGDADLRGMFVAHTCVTAAAATLHALGAPIVAALLKRQEQDGRWRGYWWSDDEYTTWLAVDALTRADVAGAAEAVRRARRWALARFDSDRVVWSRDLAGPSPFAGALCLLVVLAGGARRRQPREARAVRNALAALLAMQDADGGWPAAALMRMPPTDAIDGDARPAETAVSADDRRLFTTATVLRSLVAAQRALQDSSPPSRTTPL